ncbi:S8 family serine peptidase [Tateyamaria sp. SN3-11]|uniref:S8 family serine peptidase n=1 Tax=Tateyamaria sp. SN3-11 TaxID=3092147 RepID=UPI0039EB1198
MTQRLCHLIALVAALWVMPALDPTTPMHGAAWADDDDDGDDGDSDNGDNGDYGDDDDDDDDGYDSRSSGGQNGTRSGSSGRQPGANMRPGLLRDLLFGRQAPPPPPARAPSPAPAPIPLPERADDEIVVLDLSEADLGTLLARGYDVIRTVEIATTNSTMQRLRVPDGLGLTAALDEVRALQSGQASDFNHFYRTNEAPEVPCEGLHCTSFNQVRWTPPASETAQCGHSTVRIGLIDTGINPDHEAFLGSQLDVLDFDTGADRSSGNQHGTAVAALLIGARSGRAQGLLPDADLVAVNAFYRAGRDERSDVFNLVSAMDQLAIRGVRVMNMSLAGPHNALLENMVTRLSEDQTLIVSAAGNGGSRGPRVYPGGYDPVMTVTAVDVNDRVYRRASRGAHVDLAAPGVEVWTAASVRGIRTKTGTSFATPFATAAAAVLMSAQPGIRIGEVKAFLRNTAVDLGEAGVDETYGAGLVQFAPICAPIPSLQPVLVD